MDFSNAKELLELCDSNKMSISEVMKQRECDESTSSIEEIDGKLSVMHQWDLLLPHLQQVHQV